MRFFRHRPILGRHAVYLNYFKSFLYGNFRGVSRSTAHFIPGFKIYRLPAGLGGVIVLAAKLMPDRLSFL
jgi:hypothetical protein